MIELLRQARRRHGYVTARVIDADPAVPDVATYRKHFGALTRAYELAGLPHEQGELLREAHRRSVLSGAASGVPGRAFGRAPFSDEQLLEVLRDAYARRGDISFTVLASEAGAPSPWLYRCRFGSLARAYLLAQLPAEALNRYRVRRFIERIVCTDGPVASKAR
jgi:hypothetical protein